MMNRIHLTSTSSSDNEKLRDRVFCNISTNKMGVNHSRNICQTDQCKTSQTTEPSKISTITMTDCGVRDDEMMNFMSNDKEYHTYQIGMEEVEALSTNK